jgi:hypothetical protein
MLLKTLNLKKEIEKITNEYNIAVKCANVDIKYFVDAAKDSRWEEIKILLKVNFSLEEFSNFEELVDVDIQELSDDNGSHHGQYVKIWFTDGSWIECTDIYSRVDEGAQAFYYRRFQIDEECL